MTHIYELREFRDDGSINTVLKISCEPKYAKQRAKSYAERNPGLYSLERIETVSTYFTGKNVDSKNSQQ